MGLKKKTKTIFTALKICLSHNTFSQPFLFVVMQLNFGKYKVINLWP